MSAALPVRVMVQEAWDEVRLALPPEASVAEVKRAALRQAGVASDPDAYLVKYRGATLLDEGASLAEAGVVPDAALIVLSRRRRPVR